VVCVCVYFVWSVVCVCGVCVWCVCAVCVCVLWCVCGVRIVWCGVCVLCVVCVLCGVCVCVVCVDVAVGPDGRLCPAFDARLKEPCCVTKTADGPNT